VAEDEDNYEWLNRYSSDPRDTDATTAEPLHVDSAHVDPALVEPVPLDLTPDARTPVDPSLTSDTPVSDAAPTNTPFPPPAPAASSQPPTAAGPSGPSARSTGMPPPPDATLDADIAGMVGASGELPPRAPAPPPNARLDLPSSQGPVGPPPAPAKKFPTGIAIRIALGIAVVAVIFFVGRGTTSAGSLEPGDCFAIPDESFERVDNQDCAEPHEAEIYAEVTAATFTVAESLCLDEMFVFPESALESLPNDTMLSVISEEGSTEFLCLVESPSGSLVGSLTNE